MHWQHWPQPNCVIDLYGVTLAADWTIGVAANLNGFNLGVARIP
jgi:hypothetical protein